MENSPFVGYFFWDIVWNVFFGIFLGYGKHILQRIYIYIFQHVFGPFFLETSTMIRLANPRSDDPETPWLEQARNDPEMLS